MPPRATAPKRPTPRSAVRLVQILDILAETGEGRSLASLSKEMGTPKSSVLNLLRSLTASGHVDHVEGFYRLGGESFRMASAILSKRRFPEIAYPTLTKLVEETGETALIGTLSKEGGHLVYIAKAESNKSLRFAVTIGDRRPLYCTAGGLVILAFQSQAKTEEYVRDVKLEQITSKTKTSKKELRDAIDETRRLGYAFNMDEATEGVTGVAVPIFDETGVVGSLSVAVPTARIGERMGEMTTFARAAGHEISRIMGADPTLLVDAG